MSRPKQRTSGRAATSKSPSEDQFMAAAIGDVEWLRQSLKESGAPGEFDRNGLAAIHLAAIHGRLDCLRLLIEQHKCDVNSASSTGWRPVHLCISGQTGKRSLQCLLYLLEKGADHSCLNDDMVTPVHQAASEGHLQALQLLMKLGAKLDQADVRGLRPIDMAKIWGHRKCARLLATETWHASKDQLAKKLNMEKRVAMRDLLRQFEKEEAITTDMRYQGNEAFTDWVQQVEEGKSQHRRRHKEPPQPSQPTQDRGVAAKAAKVAKTAKATTRADGGVSPAERHRQPKEAAVEVERDPLAARVREVIEEANEALDGGAGKGSPESRRRRSGRRGPEAASAASAAVGHARGWNSSMKVTDCFHPYLRKLEDVYPRDNFTKMPHPRNSFPLRLNALSGHPEAALTGADDLRAMRAVGRARDADSGEGDTEEEDGEEPPPPPPPPPPRERTLREQLFACRSVLDIQRRKRFEEAVRKYRGEAAAHLSSDCSSFLFRDALGLLPMEEAASSGPASAAASASASASSSVAASVSGRRTSGQKPQTMLSPKLKV